MALLEREISRMPKKALLIDGLPRDMDQISYSLFYRALVGYREDPDFFVLIQIPEAVIDARMKTRVVCPKCHNPRSLKLLPTKYVGYLPRKKEFYLMCDNKKCQKAVMEPKEGDHLGIKHIKKRLDRDQALMEQALKLHGIPKILLRNAVPVTKAKRYVDDYELTPMYSYQWDPGMKRVITNEEPWIVKDDQGVPSYSLLAPAVVVTFIKQMVQVLGL